MKALAMPVASTPTVVWVSVPSAFTAYSQLPPPNAPPRGCRCSGQSITD